jgi:glycosyltransferase involved in cell wall biosynthesis
LSLSDLRVANSDAGLRSRRLSTESGKDFVVHNGFDLARARGWDRPLAPGTPVVGMIAEFNRYKDYATFVTAALRLLQQGWDAEFVMVGDGETMDQTRALVPSGCSRIKFLGRRRDIEAVVPTFSIGTLATFTEGLSNSIMEYMAFAKPVVATDGGGSREVVIDGRTGFLVPPCDPQAFADRIAWLLDRPDAAREMGKQGRLRIEREFGLDSMIDKTIGLYERAASDESRKRAVASTRSRAL